MQSYVRINISSGCTYQKVIPCKIQTTCRVKMQSKACRSAVELGWLQNQSILASDQLMCPKVLQLMEQMRNFLGKVFKLYLKQRSGIVLPLRQDFIQGRVLQNTTGLIRVGEVFLIQVYLFSSTFLYQGYQWILKDLEDTQNQLRILKQYYLKVKEIQQQTNLITPEGNQVFEAGAERRLADLEREKCTVFIAGRSKNRYPQGTLFSKQKHLCT